MRTAIVLAALIATAAFPSAARAACDVEAVASAQEIAEGWTIHEDLRIVNEVDSAPYEQGAGNWFVERETTTLPICSVFDDLGGYSLRSYMLPKVVTTSRLQICQATAEGRSVPFVAEGTRPRPAATAHEVYSPYNRPYTGSCPPPRPTANPVERTKRP
jgi:hypothetical protein